MATPVLHCPLILHGRDDYVACVVQLIANEQRARLLKLQFLEPVEWERCPSHLCPVLV